MGNVRLPSDTAETQFDRITTTNYAEAGSSQPNVPVTLMSKLRASVADRKVFRTPLEELLELKNRKELSRARGSMPPAKSVSIIQQPIRLPAVNPELLKKAQKQYKEFTQNFGVTPANDFTMTSSREMRINIRDSSGESVFKDSLRRKNGSTLRSKRASKETLPRVVQQQPSKEEDTMSTVY